MKSTAFLSVVSLAVLVGGQNVLQTNDDGWAVANIRALNDALNAAGFDVILILQISSLASSFTGGLVCANAE